MRKCWVVVKELTSNEQYFIWGYHAWDLRSSCVQLLELQTQITIQKNMKDKHHLLDVPQFTALFPEPTDTFLRVHFIRPLWVGRCKRKTTPLTWEKLLLRSHPAGWLDPSPLSLLLVGGDLRHLKSRCLFHRQDRLRGNFFAIKNFPSPSNAPSGGTLRHATLSTFPTCLMSRGQRTYPFVPSVPLSLISFKFPTNFTGPVRLHTCSLSICCRTNSPCAKTSLTALLPLFACNYSRLAIGRAKVLST